MSKSTSINEQIKLLTKTNIRIWEDTMGNMDKYDKGNVIEININDYQNFDYQNFDSHDHEFDQNPDKSKSTILVVNNDLLTVAEIISKKGTRPLIVNMAHPYNPMNMISQGLLGDEWDLFRRSNLGCCIVDNLYPIKNDKMLYYDKITIFKDSEFNKIKNPFEISVLSANPPSRPQLIGIIKNNIAEDAYINKSDEEKMRLSIECLLATAIKMNHKCIIISDYGCSSHYENPIHKIIEFFNEAIIKYPVPYIIFAISMSKIDQIKTKNKSHSTIFTEFHEKIIR